MAKFPQKLRSQSGVVAHLVPDRLIACLQKPAQAGEAVIPPQVAKRLASLGMELEPEPANHGPELLWFRIKRAARVPDTKAVAAALRRAIAWVGPVYQLNDDQGPGGLVAPRLDTILIRSPANDSKLLNRVAASSKAESDQDRSRWLHGWRYLRLPSAAHEHALDVAAALRKEEQHIEVEFEYVPYRQPFATVPNDPLFVQQWNMVRVGAPDAWAITTGDARVVVAVIDSGCDLGHADLSHAYVSAGFNAGDATLDGSPIVLAPSGRVSSHGTFVAGVLGAAINNATGIAGLAGGCSMLPIALPSSSTVETAVAIRRAVAEGAHVLNLSWAIGSFFFDMHTREAIDEAIAAGCLVCAAAGNGDGTTLVLPAGYPPVMACGGSDEADVRWRNPAASFGSHWGDSVRYGAPTGISVVAPAINVTTTDVTGLAGFTVAPSPAGDYAASLPSAGIPAFFNATSAATPHVAAAGALLLSAYPSLSATEVRRVIERCAARVGGYAYAEVDDYPNGSRHPEMGYGRLDVARALGLGDVMIRDWPSDNGVEPSRPPGGNFWSTSDIVIRPGDDGVFDPTTPALASELVRGRDHTVYVRVRNVGPAEARNVSCELRATPYVGLQFIYPDDWTREDALHVRAAPLDPPIATLPVATEQILRFALSAAQVDSLAGWTDTSWHPCLLAVVQSDNDYAFASARGGAHLQTRRNNLAQRNLTVVTVEAGERMSWPFVAGHPDTKQTHVGLAVEVPRALLATGAEVLLVLADDKAAFPTAREQKAFTSGTVDLGNVKGAELVKMGKRVAVRLHSPRAYVDLALPRAGRRVFQLVVRLPKSAAPHMSYPLQVQQRDAHGQTIGGAALVVRTGKS